MFTTPRLWRNLQLGLLKHTFKYWTEESLVTLFKVYVRPHLEYCTQACTPTLRQGAKIEIFHFSRNYFHTPG